MKKIKLSEPTKKGNMSLEETISVRRSVRSYKEGAIKESDLSQLLWAAQGLTETTRGRRAAPSAGATYPLELYVAVGNVEGISAGLYKYNYLDHSLTLVKEGDIRDDLCNVCLRQQSIKSAAAVFVFTAVFKRTSARYGERARQYVFMEVGHSSQNLHLQAEPLGLGTVAVGAFDDDGVKRVLGLQGEEEPVYLMPVGKK